MSDQRKSLLHQKILIFNILTVHKTELESHSKINKKQRNSVAFIFWVSHYVMISNDQYEDEYAKKIGKEAKVLIINHLQEKVK